MMQANEKTAALPIPPERTDCRAANALRDKIRRAANRGTGCRLTPDEVFALDFMEGGGDWWEDSPVARLRMVY